MAPKAIKRLLKLSISSLLWAFDHIQHKLSAWAGRPQSRRVIILYYHAVPDEERHRFARQMDLLRKLSTPITADVRQHSNRPGLYTAVTFDDGFHSVVKNALPELKQRGIPCTIFFPTGSWNSRPKWIVNPAHPSWNERVLSRDELRVLANEELVSIASHSVTHPHFPSLSSDTAYKELVESKTELEQVIGKEVDLFSFPHGAHNGSLIAQAHRAGYKGLYTVQPDYAPSAQSTFLAGRVATDPWNWEIEFRLKLLGAYRWQNWLSRTHS